jgi:hypothetical protein
MPAILPAIDPAVEIVVSTTGMTQGTAQTDGGQIKPRLYLKIGQVQAGLLWRNIDSDLAGGVGVLFVRTSRKLGRLQLDGGVAYRIRTGVKVPHQSHAWEFNAGLRRDFGKLSLGGIVEYSPREFERGYSLFVEGGPTLTLSPTVKASANVGRRERRGAPDYSSANIGLTKMVFDGLALDLRYYTTSKPEIGERFRARLVASARWSL